MENASKALIMAGAVLIAVAIISIFIYVFSAIGNFRSQEQAQLQSNQIIAANRFFVESAFDMDSTAYGIQIYGYDVYNIIRKIADINNDPDGAVEIENASSYTEENFVTIVDGEIIKNLANLNGLYTYNYYFDSEGYVNRVSFSK